MRRYGCGAMIAYLEGALQFAEEIKDADTAYLIERALDEARAKAIIAARNALFADTAR
jgi:hypothetical protein